MADNNSSNIGMIVIVIVVILAGIALYHYWGRGTTMPTEPTTTTPAATQPAPTTPATPENNTGTPGQQ